jgi:hypothetical protein
MRNRSVVRAMHEVVSGGRTARGKTKGKIGCHGGKVESERPRPRSWDGREQAVPSWQAAVAEVGPVSGPECSTKSGILPCFDF